MIHKLIDKLVCPVCKNGLAVDGNRLLCLGGKHSFDLAKEGYVNLAVGHAPGGDSKQAVAARTSFLEKDYYAPAAQALEETVQKYLPAGAALIDAGCGQGWYSNRIAAKGYGMLGFDLSKFGCARAAKDAARLGLDAVAYVVASVYTMPVADASVQGVLNIFAPCAEQEYKRVLADGGYLFLLGAGQRHLMGLKQAIYQNTYENAERADLPTDLEHVETCRITFEITVKGQSDIQALFSMTPYYWRTAALDRAKLDGLEGLTTEVDMLLYVYRK